MMLLGSVLESIPVGLHNLLLVFGYISLTKRKIVILYHWGQYYCDFHWIIVSSSNMMSCHLPKLLMLMLTFSFIDTLAVLLQESSASIIKIINFFVWGSTAISTPIVHCCCWGLDLYNLCYNYVHHHLISIITSCKGYSNK